MRCPAPGSSLARRWIPVLSFSLLLPGTAQASTIGSVRGLYELALVFAGLCLVLCGTSFYIARKARWTLAKDWWRLVLLLLASFFGAVLLTIPVGSLFFG